MSSASRRQRRPYSFLPSRSATFAPRSNATQHITFEETNWRLRPRISQIPLSGLRHSSVTVERMFLTISHMSSISSSEPGIRR